MSRVISTITYHFARELKYTRYPEIKGLSTEQFKEQISYIKRDFNIISRNDLIGFVNSGESLQNP